MKNISGWEWFTLSKIRRGRVWLRRLGLEVVERRGHVEGHDEGLLDFVAWRSRYTPASWKRCLQYGIAEAAMLERIREATLKGLPLGSPAFLERVESEYGVRVRPGKPGPKPAMRKAVASETYVDPLAIRLGS